jgi:hypothetical protein
MRRETVTFCLASCMLVSAANAGSKPRPGEAIGYFLTRTQVDIVVAQRIASCPVGDDKLEIATGVSIEAKPVPGEFVNVDIRSGMFAERSTKLSLRPDGTLEAFNANTQGQGGKILGAISNAAFSAIGAGVLSEAGNVRQFSARTNIALGVAEPNAPPPPPPSQLTCKKSVLEALASISSKQAEIKAIELRMAKEGGKPGDEELLDRRRNQIAKLKEGLTLVSDVTIDPKSPTNFIDAIDYLDWFEPNTNLPAALQQNAVIGRMGYGISIKPDPVVIRQAGVGDGTSIKPSAPYLVYRRPVLTAISVKPCSDEPRPRSEGAVAQIVNALDICKADETPEAKAVYSGDIVPVPQFSNLYSLRIGRGGLFGSKVASAKFDEFGTPLELEYGTSSGTDGAAEIIDGSANGLLAARDAELAALDRQIKLMKARKELADLRAGGGEAEETE